MLFGSVARPGRLDLHARLFERLAHRGEVGRLAEDAHFVALLLHVLGAGVDRRHHVVLAVAVAVDHDDAFFLEVPGDRAGLPEAAAVGRERVADLGAGAVAVVGQRLDQDRDPGRAVALVEDVFVVGAVVAGPGAGVDRFLDFVLGHRRFARLLHGGAEGRVALDVAAAVTRGDGDRAGELGEELAAFRVGGALLVFDR